MKKTKDLLDVFGNTNDDKKLKTELKEKISTTKISRFLSSIRCSYELTQSDIAKESGTTQVNISKIEKKVNDDIRIKDLEYYAKACGLNLEISFKKKKKVDITKLIEFHMYKINEYFELMKKSAKEDEKKQLDVIGIILNGTAETIDKIGNQLKELKKRIGLKLNKKDEKLEIKPPIDISFGTMKKHWEEENLVKGKV